MLSLLDAVVQVDVAAGGAVDVVVGRAVIESRVAARGAVDVVVGGAIVEIVSPSEAP